MQNFAFFKCSDNCSNNNNNNFEQQSSLTSRATAMTMPEDVCPYLCPPGATSFRFFNVVFVVLRLPKDSRELEATYCRTCLFTARKARRTTSSRGTRSTLTRRAGRRTGTRAAAAVAMATGFSLSGVVSLSRLETPLLLPSFP